MDNCLAVKDNVKPVEKITISVGEYKRLLEAKIRLEVFATYVNTEKYSVDRGICAALLGFELHPDQEEEK